MLVGAMERLSPFVLGAAVVVAGVIAAAVVGWQPVGVDVADLLWRVAIAVALALAVTVADLRVVGAAAALVVVGVALASPFVLAVAAVAVLVSGARRSPPGARRLVDAVVIGLAVVAGIGALSLAVAVARGVGPSGDAVALTREGLAATEVGDQALAADRLDRAASSFDDVADAFGGWAAAPARFVPLVGPNVAAVADLATTGGDVARAGSAATTAVDLDDVTTAGRVDLAAVTSLQTPFRAFEEMLTAADARLAALESGWLVPPVADRLATFRGEIADVRPDAVVASDLADVLPGLLGADGERRYFLAFANPAESRGLGGFMGGYGELTANDGVLDLPSSGRINDLNEATPALSRRLTGPPDYLARYARFRPSVFLQNVTASPDLPTVAGVIQQLYPQAGGQTVDGVVYVDTKGLSALLRLTGPVMVAGAPAPLDADNVVALLERDQYVVLPDVDARADLQSAAAAAVFDALTNADLPAPRIIVESLAPAVAGGHLSVWFADPAGEAIVARAGADGRFPSLDGGDLLSIRSANTNPNKIDSYLHRRIAAVVEHDPATGEVRSSIEIRLRNDAPVEGLPEYAAGNLQGNAFASNQLLVSVYSPLGVRAATIDGEVVGVEVVPELGVGTGTVQVLVDAGRERVVRFDLVGNLAPGAPYRLIWSGQPRSNPDEVTIEVRSAGQRWVSTTDGLLARGDGPPASFPPIGVQNLFLEPSSR